MEMASRSAITAVITLIAFGCTPLFAVVLSGPEYFDSKSHTFVDFETDGDGATVLLAEGSSRLMPSDEYASLGFTFDSGASWLNDGGTSTEQAQAIYGGGYNVMKFPYQNIFSIYLSTPIDAFGFWLMKSNSYPNEPIFEAYTYGIGGLIETAEFSGDLIDGSVNTIDYGFLGIAADEPITRIDITTDYTLTLDNFMFIPIPEPTTLLLVGLGGLLFRKRK